MKTKVLAILIVCMPFLLMAQEEEKQQAEKSNDEIRTFAPKGKKMSHGGYFGLTTHYSKVKGEDAFLVGIRAGHLLNHVFLIGFSAKGFVNDMSFNNIEGGRNVFLQGGYGGLFLEPVLFHKQIVHVTFPILIGGGGMVYNREGYYSDWGEEDAYEDWETIDTDAFFVVEPGLNVEFNVARFFRIGVEANYRYVNGLQLMNTSANALNGWSGGINLKFGKF